MPAPFSGPSPAAPTDALLNPDSRFRLLVDSVQDYAIFMLDPEGRVLTWNAGAQRLKGWAAEEIVGHPLETFYPPEVAASGFPREALRRALADGRFEAEGWRVRRDGSRFWASVVITALRDGAGRHQGYAKVTRDLTERRAQEEALRRSEEQLRLLVNGVQDYAIFMLDPEGRVLTWNAGAELITGHPAPAVLGQDFALFFTDADRAAGLPERELQQAVREGRARTEGWRLRRDGSRFWAGVTITPVRADDGQLRGFAKVTRDLSVQRKLTALELSSQRMSAFLAMLGHELRNPLAPIRNATALLRRLPDVPAPALRSTGIIERQLDHLVRLVDDLLDVGRIVTGKVVLQRRRLDWQAVVQASLEVARPLAQARQQALVTELPDEALPVDGDLTRLVQSLQNLLHNAVRYTDPGGRIVLAVRREADGLVTTVRDTGRGIAADDLERVFDLFVQAEATAGTADGGGLGIGLSLARTLVEGHGGSLVAASDGPGRGACFTLRLPLARGPQPGGPQTVVSPWPPASTSA